MKTKILVALAMVAAVAAAVIVMLPSRRGFAIEETHLPQAVSNYTRTFNKLDTAPAHFPEGKASSPAKTNLSQP